MLDYFTLQNHLQRNITRFVARIILYRTIFFTISIKYFLFAKKINPFEANPCKYKSCYYLRIVWKSSWILLKRKKNRKKKSRHGVGKTRTEGFPSRRNRGFQRWNSAGVSIFFAQSSRLKGGESVGRKNRGVFVCVLYLASRISCLRRHQDGKSSSLRRKLCEEK